MILALPSPRAAGMVHKMASMRLPPVRQASSSPPLPTPPPSFRPHQQRGSTQHHPQHHSHPRDSPPRMSTTASPTAAGQHEDDFSLSDEDMLLCDDEDVWSDASCQPPTAGTASATAAALAANCGRSRRLLSLEQSNVLYKILDKTHFPPTQLREAAAAQLGVSPRKVQVWFQNRRQVGKKRMMESVSSFVSCHAQAGSIPMEVLQDQVMHTLGGRGGRFGDDEDERTRAWRRHTIRLALNPGAQEEEECRAAIRELERGAVSRDMHEHQRYSSSVCGQGRPRNAQLRIDVPHHPHALLAAHASLTPTYTGPGSATHLEPLRTPRGFPLPPLTPATRSIIVPTIVTSQKESFSARAASFSDLKPHHQPQQWQAECCRYPDQSRVEFSRRDRSATLAAGVKSVRGTMTAEWSAEQRRYLERITPPQPRPRYKTVTRYRSWTDALSRLPPLLPSVRSTDRFSPYPPAGPPRPQHALLCVPPPSSFETMGGRRNRSISTPIHPPPTSRPFLRLSPPHPSPRWITPPVRLDSTSPKPLRLSLAHPTARCHPHRQDVRKDDPPARAESDKRDLMDVKTLTSSNIVNVPSGQRSV